MSTANGQFMMDNVEPGLKELTDSLFDLQKRTMRLRNALKFRVEDVLIMKTVCQDLVVILIILTRRGQQYAKVR